MDASVNGNEWRVKGGLAGMLKGGGVMDGKTGGQAKKGEQAGAFAVKGGARVPGENRNEGGGGRGGAG